MEPIKFSVVITTLNEEKSIGLLLTSLAHQTHMPTEVIVVDAGSTDKTTSIASLLNATVITALGVNRSEGRNIGIEVAKNEHIVVTDAGCVADKHWLEKLAIGFGKAEFDSVAGFYTPVITAPIHHLFAAYVATSKEHFDEQTYLPSSRSLAFTKKIWREIGKYPEHLSTCEDLVFAHDLKSNGSMTVCKEAIVHWIQSEDFSSFFKQIAGYARGDVEARYMPHVWRIMSVWGRYVLFSLYPLLLLPYFGFVYFKHRSCFDTTRLAWMLPAVQIVSDFGVMWGSIGVMSQISNKD